MLNCLGYLLAVPKDGKFIGTIFLVYSHPIASEA
jgi:hypothetical protein